MPLHLCQPVQVLLANCHQVASAKHPLLALLLLHLLLPLLLDHDHQAMPAQVPAKEPPLPLLLLPLLLLLLLSLLLGNSNQAVPAKTAVLLLLLILLLPLLLLLNRLVASAAQASPCAPSNRPVTARQQSRLRARVQGGGWGPVQ